MILRRGRLPQVCATESRLGDRRALATRLGLDPGGSEETLVRESIRRWGVSAPSRWSGRFAIVMTDPDAGTIHLIRDHQGTIPLYYAVLSDAVVCSTDLRAVLSHPEVDDELDLEAVAFQFAGCHRPMLRRSSYRNVAKVPPGTVVSISRNAVRESKYWRPEEIREDPPSTMGERADGLRNLLEVVVTESVDGAGEVGAHLSGGLDSTTLAVMTGRAVRAQSGRDLAGVFSWSPDPSIGGPVADDPLRDERRRVSLICEAQGWTPCFVAQDAETRARLAAAHPLDNPDWAWWQEEPVARSAHDRGISVMISGWGGDEAISNSGSLYRAHLLRQGKLLRAATEARQRARLGRGRTWRVLASDLRASAPRWAGTASSRLALGPKAPLVQVWREHRTAVSEELQESARIIARARTVREQQVALLSQGHLTARAEAWALGGAGYGVSYRYPLLDARILRFALSSPPQCFSLDGHSRYLFRLVAADCLPGSLAWRVRKAEPTLTRFNLTQDDLPRLWQPTGNVGLDELLAIRAEAARRRRAERLRRRRLTERQA